MLSLLSGFFAPAAAEQDYSRAHYALLAVIMAAGTWLRFWGLGNVGLFGDEETMAMPAMAILDQGLPYLPSGMFYPRALAEIYLMSASVLVFGENEWAFRFPSAVVGSFMGLAAFFMGRRFLSPSYNVAFVATLVFLPSMIEVSQTARMYVFWVTALIVFSACVFRWERDQRFSSLLWAMLAWTVALHFHTVSILAAPLLLFPGLTRQSWRQLAHGIAGLGLAAVLFKVYSDWTGERYPDDAERPQLADNTLELSNVEALTSGSAWLVVASIVLIVGLGAFLLWRNRRGGLQRAAPIVVVASALLAMALLEYHVGGIVLLIGVIWWLRSAELPRSWLAVWLLIAVALTAVHLALLSTTGLYVGRQLIGALIGHVSVWPILRFFEYAPLAVPVYGLAVLLALTRLVKRQPIPVHFLFFAIAVWAPLVLIGAVEWYVPPRYTQGSVAYFVMCVFAGLAFLVAELNRKELDSRARVAVLVLISVAIINPIELAQAINPSYGRHPDHKGAAEYLQSLEPSPGRVVIAEDILQQTYYLGRVDYMLREIGNVEGYSVISNGRIVDQYTSTEILGTGAELLAVLEGADDRDVYIIGSGEDFVDGSRSFRGEGIGEVLESDLLEVVYDGRDGKTKVWRRVR